MRSYFPHKRGATSLAALILLGPCADRCAGSDARADLLAQYAAPATALLDHYSAVRASYEFREPAGPGRTRVSTATVVSERENFRCDGVVRVTGEDGQLVGKEVRTLDLRNSVYSFGVSGDDTKGYAVQSVVLHSDKHSPWATVMFPVADPWRRRTYIEMFRDPETVVRAVRRQPWRGRDVVAVEIEYTFRDSPRSSARRAAGCYCFDPSLAWACVGEWSIPDAADRARYEAVYRYVLRDGWPVPTRDELWEVKAGTLDAGRLVRGSDITEYVPVPPPDDAGFRLTAFGLPEPVGVAWPRRTGWMWWTAGAAGTVAAAVTFGFLKRRAARRRAGALPPPSI